MLLNTNSGLMVVFNIIFPYFFCLSNNPSWQRRMEHLHKCSHGPQVWGVTLQPCASFPSLMYEIAGGKDNTWHERSPARAWLLELGSHSPSKSQLSLGTKRLIENSEFSLPSVWRKEGCCCCWGAFSHEFLIMPVGYASTQAWIDVSSSSDLKY